MRHDIIKHSILFPGGLASPSHNVIDEAEPSSLMPDATQTHNGETHNLIAQQAFEAGGGVELPLLRSLCRRLTEIKVKRAGGRDDHNQHRKEKIQLERSLQVFQNKSITGVKEI